MSNYRRACVPGATYFFTVNLADRNSRLLVDNINLLRGAYRDVKSDYPFHCDAIVILPDHIHAVWTLPENDCNYSLRWAALKSRFTRDLKRVVGWNPTLRSASKARKGDSGLWQRRFWEHIVRDQTDYAMHLSYCWMNPVKHGLVSKASEWPHSSIHREIASGRLSTDWSGDL